MKKITLYLFSIILFFTLGAPVVYAVQTNSFNENSSIYTSQNKAIKSKSTPTTQNTSSNSDNHGSFGLSNLIFRSTLFGFIIATVFCVFVCIKHKPVHLAPNANKYLNTHTINITNSYDHYIRSYTERKAFYKNN